MGKGGWWEGQPCHTVLSLAHVGATNYFGLKGQASSCYPLCYPFSSMSLAQNTVGFGGMPWGDNTNLSTTLALLHSCL